MASCSDSAQHIRGDHRTAEVTAIGRDGGPAVAVAGHVTKNRELLAGHPCAGAVLQADRGHVELRQPGLDLLDGIAEDGVRVQFRIDPGDALLVLPFDARRAQGVLDALAR